MKKIVLGMILVLALTGKLLSQEVNDKLINLGKVYNSYESIENPTKKEVRDMNKNFPDELKSASDFIIQTVTPKNILLNKKYLTLPDEVTLKYIYAIKSISDNLNKKNPVNNRDLLKSIMDQQITHYVLVDSYYGMLFNSITNKNKPSSHSSYNFNTSEYNLHDSTEKGILFLRCMEQCCGPIYSLVIEQKPSNTRLAHRYILEVPKFDGKPYFYYTDFSFLDFGVNIPKEDGKKSYKTYYMTHYYDMLLNHLNCLNKQGGTDKEKQELLFKSILKDRSFYKYSIKEAVLNNMFYYKDVNTAAGFF